MAGLLVACGDKEVEDTAAEEVAEDSAAEGEKPSVRSAHTVREPGASIEEENGPRADLTVLPPAYPPPPPPSRSRPRRAPGTRRAGRRG